MATKGKTRKARRWWVPVLPDLGLACASGARTKRKPAERQARQLAVVYRKVDLVRQEGKAQVLVLQLRDGRTLHGPGRG